MTIYTCTEAHKANAAKQDQHYVLRCVVKFSKMNKKNLLAPILNKATRVNSSGKKMRMYLLTVVPTSGVIKTHF